MALDIELIQFYRSETLDDLMTRTARVGESIGFPLLSLGWSPAPGPDAKMLKNEAMVWDNFRRYFGRKSLLLKAELARSLRVALQSAYTDTKARQAWIMQQKSIFRLFADAPTEFCLTAYQRQKFAQISEKGWTEFFGISVCQERDRTLLLIAKTPFDLNSERANAITRTLETAASAYRFLYTKSPKAAQPPVRNTQDQVLSSREVECLQWLASGKTLFEAAIILGISERTLRYHINNARDRLGVATTIQAVVAAALTYGFDPHDARRSICASSRP